MIIIAFVDESLTLIKNNRSCKQVRVIGENQREAAVEGRWQDGILHACGDIGLIDNGIVAIQKGNSVPVVLRPYI